MHVSSSAFRGGSLGSTPQQHQQFIELRALLGHRRAEVVELPVDLSQLGALRVELGASAPANPCRQHMPSQPRQGVGMTAQLGPTLL